MTSLAGRIAPASLALVVGMLCLGSNRVSAQTVAEPELKAAFLFNFAKFTEWPTDALAENAHLVMCVVAPAVAAALIRTADGRRVASHVINIRQVALDDGLRDCHVLYAEGLDGKQSERLIGRLQGAPVLTASDAPSFTVAGGVAHFYRQDGNMRFAINVAAARRTRLRLSSRLLGLAKIIDSGGS